MTMVNKKMPPPLISQFHNSNSENSSNSSSMSKSRDNQAVTQVGWIRSSEDPGAKGQVCHLISGLSMRRRRKSWSRYGRAVANRCIATLWARKTDMSAITAHHSAHLNRPLITMQTMQITPGNHHRRQRHCTIRVMELPIGHLLLNIIHPCKRRPTKRVARPPTRPTNRRHRIEAAVQTIMSQDTKQEDLQLQRASSSRPGPL